MCVSNDGENCDERGYETATICILSHLGRQHAERNVAILATGPAMSQFS
jgi:hypothetical protein